MLVLILISSSSSSSGSRHHIYIISSLLVIHVITCYVNIMFSILLFLVININLKDNYEGVVNHCSLIKKVFSMLLVRLLDLLNGIRL
mmetsp:Transcript_27394/g.30735  ORF Transcript_27394/g.30735 Transcript_27394/m.30735 type:complete len:87 (-) Transcript_27394:246-506(-)